MPWTIYLPIAQHSVSLPIMVGLGFVVGLCPVCSAWAAGF